MKKHMFTIATIVIALVFWFFDAAVHHFIYNEPGFEFIPSDINELWMRTTIVVLIMFFGLFADYFTHRIMHKEKQLEVVHVYSMMIHASHHIMINVVNQMKLFKMEALKSKDFDRDVIELYDSAIQEASSLVKTLSKVGDASENISLQSAEPFDRPGEKKET